MATSAGGLGGLIPRIADMIGGLLGSPDDGLIAPEFDEPFDEDPDDAQLVDDTEPDAETEDADDQGDDPVDPVDPESAAGDPETDAPAEVFAADEPTGDVAPVPTDQQDAQPTLDAPREQTEGSTPCEIAADELPQAGE
jgi:hypothetical protein